MRRVNFPCFRQLNYLVPAASFALVIAHSAIFVMVFIQATLLQL